MARYIDEAHGRILARSRDEKDDSRWRAREVTARERESAFVREGGERTGLGAAFLIDGSRDFYLAHRPDQKLTGSLFLFLSGPSAGPSRPSPLFFSSLCSPSFPPVRLLFPLYPWRRDLSALEGRARRMQKRGERKKRKEKTAGRGNDGRRRRRRRSTGDRGRCGGGRKGGRDRETPKAALTPRRAASLRFALRPRSESRSEQRCIF